MQYNRDRTLAFLLTIIFPFGGLVYTLFHWRESWAKNTFWLACIYMGAVLIFWPEGTLLGQGADGGRYVLRLMDMHSSSITLWDILSQYQTDYNTMDYYQRLLTFFVSRFTDNGHVLFAAFAFVFGFFYSRNVWYILERLPNKKLGVFLVLFSLFFLVCPITQINGARMWTALHVFVYAVMPYLLERDRSKFWWVLLTPLIHYSFLYVAIFALFFFFLPYKLKATSWVFIGLALVFFVGTLFVNTLNLDAVNGMLEEYSPETYENSINSYVSQSAADRRSESAAAFNWYVAASGNMLFWCYNLLLIAMFPCMIRNFKANDGLKHLYSFSLLLGGFANIMALIPSGGRFQILSQMFKVPLTLLVVMNIPRSDRFRSLVIVVSALLLLPLVFEVRKVLDFFSVSFLFGNFITVFFWENNVPIIDLIKQLI